jgi:hypothetical protein
MKLSKRLQSLLIEAVKQEGSYDPEEALPYVEEQMTADEYKTAVAFLTWVNKNGKKFGHGNIQEVFAEFRKA